MGKPAAAKQIANDKKAAEAKTELLVNEGKTREAEEAKAQAHWTEVRANAQTLAEASLMQVEAATSTCLYQAAMDVAYEELMGQQAAMDVTYVELTAQDGVLRAKRGTSPSAPSLFSLGSSIARIDMASRSSSSSSSASFSLGSTIASSRSASRDGQVPREVVDPEVCAHALMPAASPSPLFPLPPPPPANPPPASLSPLSPLLAEEGTDECHPGENRGQPIHDRAKEAVDECPPCKKRGRPRNSPPKEVADERPPGKHHGHTAQDAVDKCPSGNKRGRRRKDPTKKVSDKCPPSRHASQDSRSPRQISSRAASRSGKSVHLASPLDKYPLLD